MDSHDKAAILVLVIAWSLALGLPMYQERQTFLLPATALALGATMVIYGYLMRGKKKGS